MHRILEEHELLGQAHALRLARRARLLAPQHARLDESAGARDGKARRRLNRRQQHVRHPVRTAQAAAHDAHVVEGRPVVVVRHAHEAAGRLQRAQRRERVARQQRRRGVAASASLVMTAAVVVAAIEVLLVSAAVRYRTAVACAVPARRRLRRPEPVVAVARWRPWGAAAVARRAVADACRVAPTVAAAAARSRLAAAAARRSDPADSRGVVSHSVTRRA